MKYRNRVLNFAFLGMGAIAALTGALTPFWIRILGINASEMGLVLALQFTACLAGVLAAGRWSDRIGKTPIIRCAAACLAVGLVLAGSCGPLGPGIGFAALISGAMLMGLGLGLMDVAGSALCADLNRPEPGRALGFINFSYAAGAIAGPAAVFLAGQGREFLAPMTIATLPLSLLALVSLPGFSEGRGALPTPKSGEKARSLYGSSFMWLAGLMALLYTGIEGSLNGWLPYYWTGSGLEKKALAGLSIPASLSASWFWGFLTLGRLIYARLAGVLKLDRFLISASALLLVPAIAWLAIGPGPWILLPVALLGLGCAGVFPALITAVSLKMPQATGAAGSLLMLWPTLGSILWPALTGFGLDRIGLVWLPLVLSSCALCLGTIAVVWSRAARGAAATEAREEAA